MYLTPSTRPHVQPRTAIHSAAALRQAVQTRPGRIALDASGLDRVLRYDGVRRLVEVQIATRWDALGRYLAPHVPVLRRLRASDLVTDTVGLWIAQNGPAPDGRPAVAFVESLAIVTLDGELRRVSRTSNEKLFACVVGGHGIFGVPYSATLRVAELERAWSGCQDAPELGTPSGTSLTLLVPPDTDDRLIAEAEHACREWRVSLRLLRRLDTSTEQETRLPWATRDYVRLTLGFPAPRMLGARVRTGQAKADLIDAAIRLGGTYSIADTPEAGWRQVQTCYPALAGLLVDKRRYDPGERLQNAWYRHHRRLLGGADTAAAVH